MVLGICDLNFSNYQSRGIPAVSVPRDKRPLLFVTGSSRIYVRMPFLVESPEPLSPQRRYFGQFPVARHTFVVRYYMVRAKRCSRCHTYLLVLPSFEPSQGRFASHEHLLSFTIATLSEFSMWMFCVECSMTTLNLSGTLQTSTGQCLDMMVQGEATVAQLRGYINSTAGFEAAGPSKRLLYK